MGIRIPATGTGDATPTVGTDKIASVDYQQVKIVDGTIGGTQGAIVDSLGNLRTSLAAATALVGTSVSNFPSTQPISIASSSITESVRIASSSITQPISVASTNVTQPVSGSVNALNVGGSATVYVASQPAQTLTGLVGASISNTPAVSIASTSITVGVSVANYPINVGSVSSFPAAAPAGGASPYHYVSGASVNQVNVKNAAGTVYTLAAMNQNVSQRYLKLFDKSTVPSPGTDLPRQTYMIPGASAGAGAVIPLPVGMCFASGIGFAITANISDLDATAVGASDVVVNMTFA